jgi:WD40 repeat protein
VKLDLANPLWQQALPAIRSSPSDAPVAACAFNRDGSLVGFALGDGRVCILPGECAAPAALPSQPVHSGVALCLIGDPAGDGFVSGGDDGRLLRISPDGTPTEVLAVKGRWFEHLARHQATASFAATAGRSAYLVKDSEVREFTPHQSTVAGVDFSKDGSRIACAHYGGVTIWNVAQAGAPSRRFAWAGSHVALKWSTDGRFVATATQENDIHVWRMAQATDMRMQGYPAKVKSLSWSSDGRFLFTSAQPVLTAWSFAGKGPEGKPPLQFGEQGAGLLSVVAASPVAEFVAGGYDSGEIQVGDVKKQLSRVVRLSDGSPITCLAWSPDGTRLAAGNERGDLLTIDLRRR